MLMILTSVAAAVLLLVTLPGYMQAPLARLLGPSAGVLNLVAMLVGLLLLTRVLYRAPTAPEWLVDEHRERKALWFALAIIALAAISDGAGVPAGVAVISIAGRRRWRPIVAVSAAYMLAYLIARQLIVGPASDPVSPLLEAVVVALIIAVMVLFGLFQGSRRDLWRSLQQEADLATREQQAKALQAREAERTRIAREMHDSLSHRLALVSLHAGALEYRDDLDPEQAREAAGVIRASAETAAEELRNVLAVLRQPADGTAPAPTVADIQALVAAARTSGAAVELVSEMGPGEPGSATASHLFRVVQESLTNAVKHAPGEPITIKLSGGPDLGVHLTVRNPLPKAEVAATGSRLGLVGLTERMSLVGGRFTAGVLEESFVVEAWLPWS